jgi:phosphinothricin acetyltransferase
MPPLVRPATDADLPAIAAIYAHYVRETTVTFEEVPPSPAEMGARVAKVRDAGHEWLVAEVEGAVRGYAYAAPWHARRGYRTSCEVTVYLAHDATGQGLGTALYGTLFPRLEASGMHVLMAGIGLPNAGSVALHEKFGMTKVGHYAEIGSKFGTWVDVGWWQRIFPGGPPTD